MANQQMVVRDLMKRDWKFASRFEGRDDTGDMEVCEVLTKKPTKYTTHMVEVDGKGRCNGMGYEAFIETGFGEEA